RISPFALIVITWSFTEQLRASPRAFVEGHRATNVERMRPCRRNGHRHDAARPMLPLTGREFHAHRSDTSPSPSSREERTMANQLVNDITRRTFPGRTLTFAVAACATPRRSRNQR